MLSCLRKAKYRIIKKKYLSAEKMPRGILHREVFCKRSQIQRLRGRVSSEAGSAQRPGRLHALQIIAGRGYNRTFCGELCDTIKKVRGKAGCGPRQEGTCRKYGLAKQR